MNITRRQILQSLAASLVVSAIPATRAAGKKDHASLKPPRLKAGDTVGLINPAGATFHPDDVNIAREPPPLETSPANWRFFSGTI